jgi:hypothetical protein
VGGTSATTGTFRAIEKVLKRSAKSRKIFLTLAAENGYNIFF